MGLPIKKWSNLINAINQLRIDLDNSSREISHRYTYANFSLPLIENIPQKIIELPDGNNYEIILLNNSDNFIPLFIGEGGATRLTIHNSAYTILPNSFKTVKSSGSTELWGIAPMDCDLVVSIHSARPNPNPNPGEKIMIALNVKLKIGTGEKFGQDIPFLNLDEVRSDWADIIKNIVDSDQGITGKKLAYLASFQPGHTYQFKVEVDPAFTEFDSTKENPLMVHLIDMNILQTSLITAVASMNDVFGNNLENFAKKMIGFAKRGGWVKDFPVTGGEFEITPGNHQSALVFSAYTPGSTDACVITNLDKETNTFTLGGF